MTAEGEKQQITAAEVYRHLQRMSTQLDRIEHQMVPRAEFEAHKGEVFRRWDEDQAESDREHTSLHARIDGVQYKQDERERERQRQARELNVKIWVAVLAAVLSIGGSIVFGTT